MNLLMSLALGGYGWVAGGALCPSRPPGRPPLGWSVPAASVAMTAPVSAFTLTPPPLVKSTSQKSVPLLSFARLVWSMVLPGAALKAVFSAWSLVILVVVVWAGWVLLPGDW